MGKTVITTVVFDFDNTLFDTERIKEFFWRIASIHGFTQDETLEMYREAREHGDQITITMESFLRTIKEHLAARGQTIKEREVHDLIREMEEAHFLVPGAKRALEFVQRRNIERYLLSLGVTEWQEQKVKKSGVADYFLPDHILYTTRLDTGKSEALRELFGEDFSGEATVLINDKPDETRELLGAFQNLVVLVRREVKDTRYTDEDFTALEHDFPGRVLCSEDWAVTTERLKSLIP